MWVWRKLIITWEGSCYLALQWGLCVCVCYKNSHQRKYRVDGFFCLTSYKVVISIYTLSQRLVNLWWIIFQSVVGTHKGRSNGGILAWIKTRCAWGLITDDLFLFFQTLFIWKTYFFIEKKLLETNRTYTPRDASSLLFLLFFLSCWLTTNLWELLFSLSFEIKPFNILPAQKNWILFFFEVFEVYALTDLQGERERELLNESLNKKGWEL